MAGQDAGDFQQLFERLYRESHALARRLTGNDAQAESAATEAMARVYARWSRVKTLPHPEGYVLRLTVELAGEELAVDDRAADELARAVTRLAPQLRDVVALRYLTDLDEDEVGLVLGMTPEAVHAAVQEGVVQLRNRTVGSQGVSAA